MPQGISALLPYDPKGDFDQIAEAMREAKDEIVTGEVTTATRSVELNGVEVAEGQIIGLVDGDLALSGDNLQQVVQDIIEQMCTSDCELITLYYGSNVQEAAAQTLIDELSAISPDLEFELVYGGQAHYYYILSAE